MVSFEVRVKAELLGIGMDEEMLMERPEPEVDADGRVVVWESSSDDELMVTTSARIRGATLVATRSEEHPSEIQSLMRIVYAVFCLKTKTRQRRQSYMPAYK